MKANEQYEQNESDEAIGAGMYKDGTNSANNCLGTWCLCSMDETARFSSGAVAASKMATNFSADVE